MINIRYLVAKWDSPKTVTFPWLFLREVGKNTKCEEWTIRLVFGIETRTEPQKQAFSYFLQLLVFSS